MQSICKFTMIVGISEEKSSKPYWISEEKVQKKYKFTMIFLDFLIFLKTFVILQ